MLERLHRVASGMVVEPLVRNNFRIIESKSRFRIGHVVTRITGHLLDETSKERLGHSICDLESHFPYKEFGVITMFEEKLKFDFYDENHEVVVKKGGPVLSLHFGKSKKEIEEQGKASLSDVSTSLTDIAIYIGLHQIEANYLVGVTYERLASAARRSGFRTVEAFLPKSVREDLERFYTREMAASGRPMGKALVCYQTVGEFLRRHGSHNGVTIRFADK